MKKWVLVIFLISALEASASPAQQLTPQQVATQRELAASFISTAINALEYECRADEVSQANNVSTLCVEISGRAFGKYIIDEITGFENALLEGVGPWEITKDELTRSFNYQEEVYGVNYFVHVSVYEDALYIDVFGPTNP